MFAKGILLSFFVCFTAASFADQNVISVLAQSPNQELPATLNVVTWNIHKAEDRQAWAFDFVELTNPSDLMLVQETVTSYLVEDAIKKMPGFNFTMATSFVMSNGLATGVMTGAKANPVESHYLRSPDTEPIANTPKMALVQKFSITGSSEQLLVVNVHAINFVFNPAFKRQVTQIVKRIKAHVGPVLLAGDFNTWHEGRWEILEEAVTSVGLVHVPISNDHRFLELDHFFVRGMKVKSVALLDNVHTSDHYPLRATFEVEAKALEIDPLARRHSLPDAVGM